MAISTERFPGCQTAIRYESIPEFSQLAACMGGSLLLGCVNVDVCEQLAKERDGPQRAFSLTTENGRVIRVNVGQDDCSAIGCG